MNQDTSNIPDVDQNGVPINRNPLPDIVDAADLAYEELCEPLALIEGLMHHGSKTVVGGSSKAKKTWILLGIAICVAAGVDWLGRKTRQARVLYVNLEIQTVFFAKRILRILERLGLRLEKGSLDLLNLRGYAGDAAFLFPQICEKIRDREYGLIIIDPIYKCLGNRDENSAGQMTDLLNTIERLAVDSGAAVAFGAHFSKGNQAGKESIDRISGSGVFARDPDTILTMTAHEVPDAYVIEPTLRNFPPVAPFCVRWEYPVMALAAELQPGHLKQPGKVGRAAPLDQEFLDFFPKKWSQNNPRAALLSNSELTQCFQDGHFDKGSLVSCRDRAEKRGEIVVIRGLPYNQILAGPPDAARAFEHQQAEERAQRARKSPRKHTETASQCPGATTQFVSPPGELENSASQSSQ